MDASKDCCGQQHRHLRVVERQTQAFGRVGRIERHIGCAGLLDAEQADHHVERTFDKDADTLSAAHTAMLEIVCNLVGAAIQFAIAEWLTFKHASHSLRRAFGLLLE